jgi:hypothetical protein
MVSLVRETTGSAMQFSRVVWTGIVCNVMFCMPALVAPASSLAFMGFPPAPTIWLPYSAQVLLMLTLFQVPIALDPHRYRVFAWLCVVARLGGLTFFTLVTVFSADRQYWIFALYDLAFLIPLTVFLRRMEAEAAPGTPETLT